MKQFFFVLKLFALISLQMWMNVVVQIGWSVRRNRLVLMFLAVTSAPVPLQQATISQATINQGTKKHAKINQANRATKKQKFVKVICS